MDEATIEDLAFPNLLGGESAPPSPFQRSLVFSRLAASPSRKLRSVLRPRGHIPLDPPNIVSAQRCCSLRESDVVGRRVCIEPVWKKGDSEGKSRILLLDRSCCASYAAADKNDEGMALKI